MRVAMMKVFYQKDGGKVQLASPKKIERWEPEQPVLYVGWVRDNVLPKYSERKLKSEISDYLDEVMEQIAIPKLGNALQGDNVELKRSVATQLETISKEKPAMIEYAKEFLEDAQKDKDKQVSSALKAALANYEKYLEREKIKEKRAKLKKQLSTLEKKLASGEEVDNDKYVDLRKKYLATRL